MARCCPDGRPQDGSGLCAITAYFNPVGYKRRLKNYHAFRRHLNVPLVTVELSFDGSFQLTPEDADILVQLDGGDVMWQKERLLNIALGHLPQHCDSVAWLDCDVIFERDDWAAQTREALKELVVVHLFEERHNLPPDTDLDDLAPWDIEATAFSIMQRVATGHAAPEALSQHQSLRRCQATSGLAWAARRDALDAHGLYDAAILGSGDKAMLCAAVGAPDTEGIAFGGNARMTDHYLTWARPFAHTVRGRVGYLPGRIFHLWHGEMKDRQYAERYTWLKDFDPRTDIALDPQGCWRWSSDKPELHATVRRYFESRNEDGQSLP